MFHENEFITRIKKKYKEGAIFLPSPQSDKSTESQENLSHSTTPTSSLPTNLESNHSSSFNDLTLSEKETSKSFVGSFRIFGLPDLTSPVNAPPPIGKRERKKWRNTILTSTPELANAKEARDMKNQPRRRKTITKRNLNFDFEDHMEAAEESRLEKEMKDNVGDSDAESFQSFEEEQVLEKFLRQNVPQMIIF